MKKKQLLSGTEWRILKVVWEKKKVSVREVIEQAFPNGEKAYTTIQTYMNRMTNKNVLEKEKLGKANFYRPLITEKQAIRYATDSLVSRAFNGSFGRLAAYLVDSRDIKREDLEEIKKMIERKEEAMK